MTEAQPSQGSDHEATRERQRQLARAVGAADRLKDQGRLEEAEKAYRAILAYEPDQANVLHQLGVLEAERDRLADAEAWLKRSLSADPQPALHHANLGRVLERRGCLGEAVAAYERAVSLDPDFQMGYRLLGNGLRQTAQPDKAVEALRTAVSISPGDIEAYYELGKALKDAGRMSEAQEALDRVIELRPRDPDARLVLAGLLQEREHYSDAEASFRAAGELDPHNAVAWAGLANSAFMAANQETADWAYRRAVSLKPGDPMVHSSLLFALNTDPRYGEWDLYNAHREWSTRHEGGRQPLTHWSRPDPERPLRIGYLSPDFRAHSVSYFVAPLLEHHDPQWIEAYCYAEVENYDNTTRRLQRSATSWLRTHGIDDSALAAAIRDDEIDILVDLAGHVRNHRLGALAYKPAPIQANYLGYPATTGIEAIDFKISDDHITPDDIPEKFSESVARVEDCCLCFAPPSNAPEVVAPPCLEDGGVTFGSFNALPKITPATVELWARVMREVSGSRLVLKTRGLQDPGVRERISAWFESYGIEKDRLELLAPTPGRLDHLAQYGQIDIALDPLIYNGVTTTCEALWMGVPVVTLPGRRSAARHGSSLLRAVGLDDLVAHTKEDLVARTKALAQDSARLQWMRANLRDWMASSMLCDSAGFARRVEALYRRLWRERCGR